MTRRARIPPGGLLVILAMALGGCLEPGGDPGASSSTPTPIATEVWYLGGAWTQEYTQADIDAWCEVAREYDNECAVMESYPPQYGLRFEGEAPCREARAKVLALPHITARECVRLEPSDDPDQPMASNTTPTASSGVDGSRG